MATLFGSLVVIALAVLVLGSGRSRGLRRLSRVVSFVGFVLFGLVAAACLYGMVTLEGKGGGVLLFIAVPSGIIAWLFYSAFSASRGTEAFEVLPAHEQAVRTKAGVALEMAALERKIVEGEAKLGRFWLSGKARERLRGEVAHARLMLDGLRRMQPALADPANYRDDGGTSPP
ncbi:MAG: hypothetical protein CMLOHMNK_03668 [Steroidobacteraceae bacterium]|nr:hypothetical protein [Steroidobacteraceae bacterium]